MASPSQILQALTLEGQKAFIAAGATWPAQLESAQGDRQLSSLLWVVKVEFAALSKLHAEG